MAAKTYAVTNGDAPGSAAPVAIATGAAIRTMLQIATNTTTPAIRFVEWWAEFDASAAAVPLKVELLRATGGFQTTLTAYTAAMIAKVNDPNAPASSIQLGTALSGFSNTTTEVTPTGAVSLETHYVPPTSGIYVQFPLGREPEVQVAALARIRTTPSGTGPNCLAGVMWEE
jgi:hypothetical protein